MFQIENGREHFWQWDLNQRLIVDDASINEAHFSNRTDDNSLICEVFEEDGKRLVNVPNILLQDIWDIRVYAYCVDYTKIEEKFKVYKRGKPADYVYTETEIKDYDGLKARVDEIERNGVSQEAVNAAVSAYLNEHPIEAGANIDDTTPSTTTTYSSQKIEAELSALNKAKVNKAGWTANKYLGTDADGNVVTKESPASGGTGSTAPTFLNGLKYYALGDSIVDYQGTTAAPETYSGTDLQGTVHTDETVIGYIQAIENRYGMLCTNYGVAGGTIVSGYAGLVSLDYSDVALVTIAYGVNDARTGIPLGDVNSTDTATFAGALNMLLRKIYTDNPECRVLVLTPIQRLYVSEFGISTPNANGNYLIDFVNMCKLVSAKRSTKCLDMYRDSGINQTNLYYYTREGVHPLNTGYLRMTNPIISALDDMCVVEFNPFGSMTNTSDTEPEEPGTGGGGGNPPEEETGAVAVELSAAPTTDSIWRYDNWNGKYDNTIGYSNIGPIELVSGATYTLESYIRPDTEVNAKYWGFTYVACASETCSNGANMISRDSEDTGERLTISTGEAKKLRATIVVPTDGNTYYIFINHINEIDLSKYSLTYVV